MIESIIPKDRDHWLLLRSADLTSTEIPALFGVSPYVTEFELFHRHSQGTITSIDPNERTQWGTRLQDSIAAGIAEDHKWTVRKMDEYVRRPELRIGSSFDFRVRTNATEDDSTDALLEIKNVDALVFRDGWIIDDDGNVEAPPHIELQVQHQLAVTGLPRAHIGALVGGNRVVLITRDRDQKVISAIEAKAAQFWNRIDSGQAPNPDFLRDSDFIMQLCKTAEPGKIIDVTDNSSVSTLARKYAEFGKTEKESKEAKDAIKAELITLIGDAEKAVGDGFSISAGTIGASIIETYERKAYRSFRLNWKKAK